MKRLLSFMLTLAMLLSMLSGFGIVAQADVSTDGIGFDFAEEFYPSIKSGNDLYHLSRPFDKYPHTFEAWIAFPNTPTEASVLMGNSADDAGNFVNIEVNTSGNPVFRYRDTVANAYVVTFSNVNLYTGAWIHLAITLDPVAHTLNCYIDGKLAQSEYFYPDFSRHTFNNEFVIGGDQDYQNNPHFKGRVKQVAFFSDARTEAEIKADMTSLATTDADYIAGFDMTADKAKKDIADKSGNGWYLNYSDLWLTEAEVEAWRQSTGMERAYSIAVIGDIQYSSQFFPYTLKPMYQWIVDNKDAKNTVYSIGLGDITNRDTIYEWENAKNAMSVMDGKIPYSVVRGNHDLKAYSASANNNYHTGSSNYVNNSGNIGASSKGAAFDQYFATNTYYTDQFFNNGTNGGVYEEGSVMNTWRILEVAKSKWLLLNLDYAPSDSVLDWAAGVVDAHPDCKVIVSTHSYLSRNGEHNREGAYVGEKGESGVTVPGGYTDANLGVDIWEDFVSQHENIEMVLSGHIASTVNPVVQRKGVHGNTVTEILIDGQQIDDRYNGMGFVAMFFFNEDGTKLEIEYYSNVVGKYYRGANLREIDLTAEGLPYNANEWEGLSIAPEGKGTYEEPYLISNAGNLLWMSKNINETSLSASFDGQYFKQTNDIDLCGKAIRAIGSFYKNDNSMSAFGGIYDGCGYSIKNGYVTTIANNNAFTKDFGYGLFGVIFGATVKNITLDNVEVIGRGITGAIVGKAAGKSAADTNETFNKIINCTVKSNCDIITLLPSGVTAPASTAFDDDSRAGIVGGIVGQARSTTVDYCASDMDISVSGTFSAVGGIAGAAGYNAVIKNSINNGDINVVDAKAVKSMAVGGVVGMTSPTLQSTETTGDAKSGKLHVISCANTGAIAYTSDTKSTVTAGFGGILGTTGRLFNVDNGAFTSETNATVTDTPAYVIKDCYNSYEINTAPGDNASVGGLVGRGYSANEAASTLWLVNSASVKITRKSGGVNGYNAYNYENTKTTYGLLPIAVALDSEGNPTVVVNSDASNQTDAVSAGVTSIANAISNHKNSSAGELRFEYNDTTDTLTILGAGSIPDYEAGAQPWAAHALTAKTLVVGSSVTGIGNNAFSGFANLVNISLPDDLAKISASAFEGTAYMSDSNNWTGDILYIGNVIAKVKQSADKKYTIKDSVTGVMDNAFNGIEVSELVYAGSKTKWFSLVIGDGNTAVASDLGQLNFAGEAINWLFDKTTGTLTLKGTGATGDFVKKGQPWYQYVNNITKVVIEEGITSVGYAAFDGFTKVTELVLPEGLKTIGGSTFQNMGLTTLTLPSTLESTGTWAFAYNASLTNVIIPASLTTLNSSVFRSCSKLAEISIPVTLTSVGSSCFTGCSALETVHYPTSYSDFKKITVASGNDDLLNATLDCPVKIDWSFNASTGALTISGTGEMADYSKGDTPWSEHMSAIKSVTVTDDVTAVGANSFNGCSQLSTISLPETLTKIGENAFEGTAYANDSANWKNGGLYVNNVLVKITKTDSGEYTVDKDIKGIADDVFKNISVKVLNYPGKKTAWLALKFGDGNEAVATDLGQLLCTGDSINWLYDKTTGTITIKGTGNMPDYAKGTAPWTQYRLVAKKIVVENGITRVGHHSFNGAKIDNKLGYTNVTEIELPEGLTYIGNSAFQYTGASKIDIPSTVTSMGTYAFAYTDTIKSVSFSPVMKTVAGSMFRAGKSSIEKLYLPKSITSITAYAFYSTTVDTIYYSGTEAEFKAITVAGNNAGFTGAKNVIYNHTHSYTDNYDTVHHWKECVCSDIKDYGTHVFDDAKDTTCNSCKYELDAPVFSEAFTDPHGLINAKKAVILTNEAALSSAASGAAVVLSWCGEDYVFYKGENAFSTLAEIKAKGFDTPHILVKNKTEGDNFYLTFPAHAFTQNYANNPVKVGTAKDGSDWAFNGGSGEGQFNTASGVDVVYNNLGVDAGKTYTATSGEYKFYGFTMTYSFLDYSKNIEAVVTLENCRFTTKKWGVANTVTTQTNYQAEAKYPLIYTLEKNDADNDSFTLKNVYVTLIDNFAGNIFSTADKLFENITFDSVFFDIPANNKIFTADGFTLVQAGSNPTFTIKDSCFKNYYHHNYKFAGTNTKATSKSSSKLSITNTIFNESGFRMCYSGVVSYTPNSFTEITFKDNYIKSENGAQLISTSGTGEVIEGAPMKLTITGNYVDSASVIDNHIQYRNYTNDSVVDNNYTKNVTAGVGVKQWFSGTPSITSKTWLITADGSNTSSMIQPMTFNGETFDAEETINVKSNVTALNVKALISTTTAVTVNDAVYNANLLKGYTDEECETPIDLANVAVAAAGTKIYVKVFSPDGLVSELHTVVINKEKAFGITNTGLGAVLDTSVTNDNYYWVTWRGEVSSTGVAVEGEADHRVGAIYLSDTTDLNAMKAEIERNIKAANDVNAIETVVTNANATIASKTAMAYCFHSKHTLTWNNESQSYGYRYNFNIKENYYRGVVMYVVFKDTDGNIQIEFSDMVVQQAK